MTRPLSLARRASGFAAGAILSLALASPAWVSAPAAAASTAPCPTGNEAQCSKQLQIANNTGKTIYAVINAPLQMTPGGPIGNCPNGGDLWLQAALNDTSNCFLIKNDYYIYINPTSGIPAGGVASITLPWWSKLSTKRDADADTYVDWWHSARIYIFDDQTALNESFKINRNAGKIVTFDSNSAKPTCTSAFKSNACTASDMKIYRVQTSVTGSAIQPWTPYQLVEFTFADVVKQNNKAVAQDLYANYNVSYVDQIYLPVAIAPLTASGKVGYIGSTMSVSDWRKNLVSFTGAQAVKNAKNDVIGYSTAKKWPIYNNPISSTKDKSGNTTTKARYPDAGIRIPSAANVFGFYMTPTNIGASEIPQIVPASSSAPPTLIANMRTNWQNCTTSPYKNCPTNALYAPLKAAFDQNYKGYIANNCSTAGYMAPQNKGLPNINTYLFFLYGWAAFNSNNCTAPKLPEGSDAPAQYGNARVNYVTLQYNYNYAMLNSTGAKIFNPYTQLVHGPLAKGFLGASAYAFSIDDLASLQRRPATGLVLAIGGSKGLPSTARLPANPPTAYNWYTASLNLGSAGTGSGVVGWKSYGLCSEKVTANFPAANPTAIGLDPNITPSPCKITLLDTNNKKYQLTIKKFSNAGTPPYQIWPAFTQSGSKNSDPNVVACSSSDTWCPGIVETATKVTAGQSASPTFTLATPTPTQK